MLASASPRRRELLAGLGLEFDVVPAHADETIADGTDPRDAACELARRKARIVAARTDAPVLAADTIVVAADGGILGKPAGASEARAMLRRLAGTTHRVITGVCLVTDGGKTLRDAADVTHVTMRELSPEEVEAYSGSGEPFGKAGGYAIQERGDRFVTRVQGSWTNVVGLPMELVGAMLAEAGIL